MHQGGPFTNCDLYEYSYVNNHASHYTHHYSFSISCHSQSSHNSVKTSYATWLQTPSAEKWYLWNDPSKQIAYIVPWAWFKALCLEPVTLSLLEECVSDLLFGEPKAHIQATSCGTVKLANDHWDPTNNHISLLGL